MLRLLTVALSAATTYRLLQAVDPPINLIYRNLPALIWLEESRDQIEMMLIEARTRRNPRLFAELRERHE